MTQQPIEPANEFERFVLHMRRMNPDADPTKYTAENWLSLYPKATPDWRFASEIIGAYTHLGISLMWRKASTTTKRSYTISLLITPLGTSFMCDFDRPCPDLDVCEVFAYFEYLGHIAHGDYTALLSEEFLRSTVKAYCEEQMQASMLATWGELDAEFLKELRKFTNT